MLRRGPYVLLRRPAARGAPPPRRGPPPRPVLPRPRPRRRRRPRHLVAAVARRRRPPPLPESPGLAVKLVALLVSLSHPRSLSFVVPVPDRRAEARDDVMLLSSWRHPFIVFGNSFL